MRISDWSSDVCSSDLPPRPRADREDEGTDPAADVRRREPGCHRFAGHRPHHGQGDAQERAGQVLWWRRFAQEEAAGEAEGRQEADEAGRPRGDPEGGLPGGVAAGQIAGIGDSGFGIGETQQPPPRWLRRASRNTRAPDLPNPQTTITNPRSKVKSMRWFAIALGRKSVV